VGFVIACLVCLWLAHTIALLAHEYAHSFVAFALGYKSNPLVIHWGVRSASDLILLLGIDEQVDYAAMFRHGDGWAVALVGFAGAGLGNGGLYLWSLDLLRRPWVRARPVVLLFVFWFNFMNVGNFYDYVPIRTFASHGDMAHIAQGLGVSPWLVLVVLGIPTAIAMWFLFTRTLPDLLAHLPTAFRRAFVVQLSAIIMFGYFGIVGLEGYGTIAHWLSLISLLAIPVVATRCWPTRRWMRARIQTTP
jgi:hypothetical protein